MKPQQVEDKCRKRTFSTPGGSPFQGIAQSLPAINLLHASGPEQRERAASRPNPSSACSPTVQVSYALLTLGLLQHLDRTPSGALARPPPSLSLS